MSSLTHFFLFFFFNDTATTEIYTLSLHDALPIYQRGHGDSERPTDHYAMDNFAADVVAFLDTVGAARATLVGHSMGSLVDRKSTRLNSSHANISYAVFCLKKKKKKINN